MSQPVTRSAAKPASSIKDAAFHWDDPLDLEGELTEDEFLEFLIGALEPWFER